MTLELVRENNDVKINFNSSLNVRKSVYPFRFSLDNENYAELLRQHLHKQLLNAISQARREAYQAGYKDAKAKRAKETWFSGII